MQTPIVGAEWSSETTTARPFGSFFIAVGGLHCCAHRLAGAPAHTSSTSTRTLFMIPSASARTFSFHSRAVRPRPLDCSDFAQESHTFRTEFQCFAKLSRYTSARGRCHPAV